MKYKWCNSCVVCSTAKFIKCVERGKKCTTKPKRKPRKAKS